MYRILIFSAAMLAAGTACRLNAQARQTTVLDGVYTEAQAKRGEAVYAEKCAECHDSDEPSGPTMSSSTFVDNWREDPLETLFRFIRTEMPQNAAGSLNEPQYVDIVADILAKNNYKPGSAELTAAAMPNILFVGESGPRPLPANVIVRVSGCFAGSGNSATLSKASEARRTREGTSVSNEEVAAAQPGTATWQLRNIDNAEGFKPETGHSVVVKGVLNKDSIRVTAAKALPFACTP